MRKHQTQIALFLCALFLFSSALTVAFTVAHAAHGCTGDACVVCDQITNAQHTDNRGAAPPVYAFLSLGFAVATLVFLFFAFRIPAGTLLLFKVKLNY
jgi:hypothetical protein